MNDSLTHRFIAARKVVEKPSSEFGAEQWAPPELKASRLAICAACSFNKQGSCRECCAGVEIETLVRLKASRCGKNYW